MGAVLEATLSGSFVKDGHTYDQFLWVIRAAAHRREQPA
jgi:hypothetical protein